MIDAHHAHLLAPTSKQPSPSGVTDSTDRSSTMPSFADARNVFPRIGTGRVHRYEQPPKHVGHGTVHHVAHAIALGEERHVCDDQTIRWGSVCCSTGSTASRWALI